MAAPQLSLQIHRAARLLVLTALLFVLMLTMTSVTYAAMLDSLDRVMLDSALTLLKLKPAELGFDKLYAADDTFRLAVVEKYLNDPYIFPNYVDTTQAVVDRMWDDSTGDHPEAYLRFIGDQLQVDPKAKPFKLKDFALEPFDDKHPFSNWLKALNAAEPERKKFYAGLDSLDLQDLFYAAPGLWSGDEESDSLRRLIAGKWQREFNRPVDTTRNVDTDRILDIMKKMDRDALIYAADPVLRAAWFLAEQDPIAWEQALKSSDQSQSDKKPNPMAFFESLRTLDQHGNPGVTGEILYFDDKSPYGAVVIGGMGDNVYSGDFAAIIDLGGNDVYHGRYGGAMGELGHPYSLVIDFSGDDYYDSGDRDMAQGAGFLGVGVLIDKAGNDSYRAGAYAQGAGLFGVGVLRDDGGADDRRGRYFLQGAGQSGIGLLIDRGDAASDDRYLSSCWSQGFAGCFGYGLLFDREGEDTYRAGGVYYHAPLLPNDYQSFSAGFAMGWRPRAGGGIAVLYDKGKGTDFYDQEVMSIGSSYWYSIGVCIDGGGNDHYSLSQYGMGSGIHLSLGAFYDISGDDSYQSRNGVVGATPHDFSVGVMVDGGGNDYYIVGDGWGGSLTNSYGLFIDRLGNDTYATRGVGGFSFGNPRWARGFGCAAIFLDLEGKDVYPRGEMAADGKTWIQGGWGIGIDLDRDVPDEMEAPIPDITLTAEDSAKSIREVYNMACQWEVGSARETVKRGRTALLAKGMAAVDFVVNGPPTIEAEDFKNLKALFEKIEAGKTPLDEFLNGQLSDSTRQLAKVFLADKFEVDSLREQAKEAFGKALAADLNRILNQQDFYSKKLFADVKIDPEVQKEVKDDMTGSRLFHMNWHLLEQAYPEEIIFQGSRLGTTNSLENRVLEQVVTAMPDSAGPLLMSKIEDVKDLKDVRALATAISLLGTVKHKDSAPLMYEMLEDKDREKVWNTIISSLGTLSPEGAAVKVAPFCRDESEKRRIIAIGALGSLKDSTTIEAMIGGLDDPMFTVRSSAMTTVSVFGLNAIEPLKTYYRSGKAAYPELGLYALGRIGRDLKDKTDNASKAAKFEIAGILENHLADANDRLRAEAVVGLYRIGGEATRQRIDGLMEQEYSPLVISAHARMVEEAKNEKKD